MAERGDLEGQYHEQTLDFYNQLATVRDASLGQLQDMAERAFAEGKVATRPKVARECFSECAALAGLAALRHLLESDPPQQHSTESV